MTDSNMIKPELASRLSEEANQTPNNQHQQEQPAQTQAFIDEIENSVCVSIEPNQESEIYEIKFDGTEIYKEPPTYSDNLAQAIAKIDFDDNEDKANKNQTDVPTDNRSLDEITTARKFYQNIYEHVRSSLEEASVLLDCLTIAKANKLIGLESGREHLVGQYYDEKQGENAVDKSFNIILKKRNIEKSKSLLRKSQEKFGSEQETSINKFHHELYKARQTWRIKKSGNRFICDLSYRTVGLNPVRVSLELIKNEPPLNMSELETSKHQFLSVIIPDELKDYTYIQVKIVKNSKKAKSKTMFDRKFSLFTYSSSMNIPSWQEELEREQNSIYCKEIYNKMLREVFDPSTQLSQKPVIMGNSMQIMITMEYDLIISLVHTTERSFASPPPDDYNFDNALLEYYLHCLLKKSFDQNFFHIEQRPITSSFAYNSQVKIAGMAYANLNFDEEDSMSNLPNNLAHLLNKKKQINLLQSIKEKAEHLITRKKVLKILNDVSKRVNEPHLLVEQSAWNSSTSTDITVLISSSQFESMAKSFFYIAIKQSQVHVLNRSANTSISFSDSLNDLREYFQNQCTFHQINLILTLSQSFGWTLLGSSFTNEFNTKYKSGIGLIYNEKYSKKIGVKVGPVNQIQLFVNQRDAKTESVLDANLKNMLGDSNIDWIFTKDNYVKVDLDSYPGLTQMQKYELFLAHYSTNEIV